MIGGAAFLVVLIAAISLFATPGRTNMMQNSTNAALRPIQSGIRGIVSTLERMYNHMFNYDDLEMRYEALLDRIAEYERQARGAEEIRDENARLRDLMELPTRFEDRSYVDANILQWDASNWTSAFTIDRGGNVGIEVGDPVMTERGELVGIVREVGTSWATVQTILDPSVRIGGQMGSGVSAVVEGNFALMQEGRLRLSHVPSSEMPLLNDMITTSGLGGVIPSGLFIGRLTHVAIEDTGVSYWAEIEPMVDFTRLVQVFVIQLTDREG